MPDPDDREADSRWGREPGPDARGAAPVLVRPDGAILSGVDDEAAWRGRGRDELRWSFGVDLSEALAATLAGLSGGGQDELLDELEASDRGAAADAGTCGGSGAGADDTEACAGSGSADGDAAARAGSGSADAGTAAEASSDSAAAATAADAGTALGAEARAGSGRAGRDGEGGESAAAGAGGTPPAAAGDTRDEEAAADGPACGAAPGTLGLIADALPAGPGLAAWLAQCPPGQLSDADLPAVAAAARRVTSWAQATELAVAGQMSVRSAARDPKAGLSDDGRPAAVTRDAAAQVGLALTLSPGAAAWWTGLAVTVGWQVPALHAALLAGQIDLTKMRIIAEATAVLAEETARAVAGQVLAGAAGQTYGQLRAAVSRAVILADPQGAEERRRATERRARVGLYPGDNHTATLTGMNLPAIHAAAAMARLTAMARAMQAAGAGGGIDLLRAHVYLGLLLDTLPPIPPRPDAPPDVPPPDPDDPGPGNSGPGDSGPGPRGRGDADPRPAGGGGPGDDGPGAGDPDDGPSADAGPRRRTRSRGTGDPGTPPRPGGTRGGHRRKPDGRAGQDTNPDDDGARPGRQQPGPPPPDRPPPDRPPPDRPPPDREGSDQQSGGARTDRHPGGPSPGLPDSGRPEAAEARSDRLPPGGWPGDADAPADDGARPPGADVPEGYADDGGYPDYDLLDEPDDPHPIPAWPGVPATAAARWPGQPPGQASASDATPPARGLLELVLPWSALALQSGSPGSLSRIGPVTAEQARLLAAVAGTSPATRWRVILTDSHGHALAVTAIPRRATRPHPGRTRATAATARPAASELAPHTPQDAAGPPVTGLIGRVTVTVPIAALDAPALPGSHPVLAAIATAAARLLLRLQQEAQARQADPAQPGTDLDGCDHHAATPAYRPTPAIREYITARDQTCRYPYCRQPAWHADLESGGPGESHPGAPTDPYVSLSAHTALVTLITRRRGRSAPMPSGRRTGALFRRCPAVSARPCRVPAAACTFVSASAPGRR